VGANSAGLEPLDEQQVRLEIAKTIVGIFLPERIVYIALSAITAGLVIFMGAQALGNPPIKQSALAALFGSGGVVAFNLARLLTMFNTVIERVFGSNTPGGAGGH
jgi:hypothetical protein